MKTTIDKAGRLVIPSAIRRRLALGPGTEIEIAVEDGRLVLTRGVPGPKLVRVKGRLVARPTVPVQDLPDVDVAALVEEERNRAPW